MKLRIKGASLRLRLTQGEVRALGEGAALEEHVPFGGGVQLTYRLQPQAGAGQISASLAGSVLEISVPEEMARRWCASQEVTLAGTQAAGSQALRITVEKDFACLAPRSDEDESDNFPHPDTGAKVC
ncbi:MAG TPA: hypothetical protein VGF35_00530 [Steroidobacteraceae bacterium]|jgi:hypothetical protein